MIIVTVTDRNRSFYIDLEIPANLVWKKLAQDIIETLNGYRPEISLFPYDTKFMNKRTRRILPDEKTAEESGVWNGDYLVVV